MTGFVDRLAARAVGARGGLRVVTRSRFEADESPALVETQTDVEAPASRPSLATSPTPAVAAVPARSSPTPAPDRVVRRPKEASPETDPQPTASLPHAAADVPPPPERSRRDVAVASTAAPTLPPEHRPEPTAVESHVIERETLDRVVRLDEPSSRSAPVPGAPPATPPPPAPSALPPSFARRAAEEPPTPDLADTAPTPGLESVPELPAVVEVTIGRIEVTTRPVVPQVAAVPAPQPSPPGPRLEEYLAERSRR